MEGNKKMEGIAESDREHGNRSRGKPNAKILWGSRLWDIYELGAAERERGIPGARFSIIINAENIAQIF